MSRAVVFAVYSILLVKVSEAYRACGRLPCMFSFRQISSYQVMSSFLYRTCVNALNLTASMLKRMLEELDDLFKIGGGWQIRRDPWASALLTLALPHPQQSDCEYNLAPSSFFAHHFLCLY